jgi:hypothetical protein
VIAAPNVGLARNTICWVYFVGSAVSFISVGSCSVHFAAPRICLCLEAAPDAARPLLLEFSPPAAHAEPTWWGIACTGLTARTVHGSPTSRRVMQIWRPLGGVDHRTFFVGPRRRSLLWQTDSKLNAPPSMVNVKLYLFDPHCHCDIKCPPPS